MGGGSYRGRVRAGAQVVRGTARINDGSFAVAMRDQSHSVAANVAAAERALRAAAA